MSENPTTDHDGSSTMSVAPSRRVVLKSAAAMGLLSGLGSTVSGQNYAATFQLGGQRSGWQGQAPETIEGATNPPLQVVPEQQYQISWENLDGAVHNFAIVNEDGDIVQSSEFMSTQGEAQQFDFTAQETFDQYICEPHADTMRGDFEFIESQGEAETVTEAEMEDEEEADQQQQAQQEEPVGEPEMVYYLALEREQWVGIAPEAIEGVTNPTLEFQAGQPYAVVWTLRTERRRHETGHNFVIQDEDGNYVAYTGFLAEQGTSLTLRFTAEEDMAVYSDQTQLNVTGEIEVSNGGGEQDGEASESQNTTSENGGVENSTAGN